MTTHKSNLVAQTFCLFREHLQHMSLTPSLINNPSIPPLPSNLQSQINMATQYNYKASPSKLMASIFTSTINMAAKTLVSISTCSKADHLRFMVMLMTWFALWVIKVLMDALLPSSETRHRNYLLRDGFPAIGYMDLPLQSSSSSSSSSWDLVVYEGGDEQFSIRAIGRALSHILTLLNDIPSTSPKYQFAMEMADTIMDENAYSNNVNLHQLNRMALSSAFERTSYLLCTSLRHTQEDDGTGNHWTSRIIRRLPFGSYLGSYIDGVCALVNVVKGGGQVVVGGGYGEGGEVVAEKLAQELLWMTKKLRDYGGVSEALVQWSFAHGLASLSLNASLRVQGFIVKIAAMLFGELNKDEIPREVKFRLLMLWLPLFCHAHNGLSYPVLTGFEKAALERATDEVISSLPYSDQEVILTNWFQDFTISASNWPNLRSSYDRWCKSTRHLVEEF